MYTHTYLSNKPKTKYKNTMFTVIYCLERRSSCYLVADAIKAQISKSYYHVYPICPAL